MKPKSYKNRLPNINISRLISGPCPPIVPIRQRLVKIGTLKYLIWCAVNTDIGVKNLALLLDTGFGSCKTWLEAYEIKARIAPHPNKLSPRTLARMKPLFDKGFTLTQIGRKLGVDQTTVSRQARREGWYVKRKREFQWKVQGRFAPNTISTYRKYCRTIRHITNKMYEQYQSVIDPLKQKGYGYHVDHKLSIYDAFNAGDVPIPWQVVCHPANLELLDCRVNRSKGAQSSLTPKKLKKRIALFELKHGVVPMRVIVGKRSDGRTVYNQTMHETIQQRIKRDSTFTLRQARQIAIEGRECPKLEFRTQLRRPHYEYIVWAYIQSHINRRMAYELGCNVNAVKRAMDRIGLTRPTKDKLNSVVRLASRGYTIKYVAETLGITSLEALCLYELKRKQE